MSLVDVSAGLRMGKADRLRTGLRELCAVFLLLGVL